jgi:hypothetical protein
MDSRFRPPSPGSRRLNNPPMRASTGTLGFNPYDNYLPGQGEFYTSPATGPEFEPLEPGRPSRRDHRDYSTSPPRRPSRRATHSAGGDGRVPPPIAIIGDRRRRSPSGSRPIIHGGLGNLGISPGTTPADDGEYYITPHVSDRRRHSGRVYYPGERPAPGDEGNRDRDMDRPHYRTSPMGPGGRRGYHLSGPLVRNPDADGYDDRDAREPMYRRARRQRVSSLDVPPRRGERPLSMAGLEEHLPPVAESGPPPPSRGFGGLSRSRSVGRSDKPSRDFTTDPNPFDGPPRGRPVSVHQRKPHTYASSQSPMPGAFPDDGYDSSPYDDEFEARGYSDPPIELSFRGVDDRRREPRRGPGDGRLDRYEGEGRAAQERERAVRERRNMDEEWERHMRRESGARSQDRRDDRETRAERDERFGHADGRDRHRSQGATNSRPAPAAPIKGILREPRERFPEDPEPIREGALPLREKADHLGIPQEARWTKISRKLVNPAALQGRERFEATEGHVIVLRVLTPDEIDMYTERTRRIRGIPRHHVIVGKWDLFLT